MKLKPLTSYRGWIMGSIKDMQPASGAETELYELLYKYKMYDLLAIYVPYESFYARTYYTVTKVINEKCN